MTRRRLCGATLLTGISAMAWSTTASATVTAPSAGTGGFLVSPGTCIVPTATPPHVGTGIQTGSCTDPGAETFTLGPGIQRAGVASGLQGTIMVGGLCLDTNSNGSVVFNNCNWSVTQQWQWSLGRILSVANPVNMLTSIASAYPVGVAEGGQYDQVFMPIGFNVMFASGIGASSQFSGPHPFYVPPTVPASAKSNYQCLDVLFDLESFAGEPIDNFQCNATNAQWFHFTPSLELMTSQGYCVTAPTAAGGNVEVFPCNGTVSQQWLYSAPLLSTMSGAFFGVVPSLCAMVNAVSSSSGTLVVTAACDDPRVTALAWDLNLIFPPALARTVPAAPVIERPINGALTHAVATFYFADPSPGTLNAATSISWILSQNNVVVDSGPPAAQPWTTSQYETQSAPMSASGTRWWDQRPLAPGTYNLDVWSTNSVGNSKDTYATFTVVPDCPYIGQNPGSGACCPNLQKNTAGVCEPTDPAGCGATSLVGEFSAPCCKNSAPCKGNATCLTQPLNSNATYCSANTTSTGSPTTPTLAQTGGVAGCALLYCEMYCEDLTHDEYVPEGLFCTSALATASANLQNQTDVCTTCCGDECSTPTE